MKIGIDLDGVIFDTERVYGFYSDIWDLEHHGLDNILDNSSPTFQQRFRWSDDEIKDFYKKYAHKIIKNTGLNPGVKETLIYLKSLGYDLYVVSMRGFYNKEEIDITLDLFKKEGLDVFTECIFEADDKRKVVVDKKIDYVIDDNLDICNSVSDICKTIYFKGVYAADATDKSIITVHSWQDIYRYFKRKESDRNG